MPRVENPPHLPGFEYYFAPTSICCIPPQDTPAEYFTATNPTGKHKLTLGGYKCSAGRRCVAVYCYNCATEHLGQIGVDSLAEYHRKFCKEQVGIVNRGLKRPAPDQQPQTLVKKPRMSSELSDPPTSPESGRSTGNRRTSTSAAKISISRPGEPSRRRSTRSRPTKSDEDSQADDISASRRRAMAATRRNEAVESGTISGNDRSGAHTYDTDDLDVEVAEMHKPARKKARPMASINRLPEPPQSPFGLHDPRNKPGATWPSLNYANRTPAVDRSRNPETFRPTGEEYRRFPTRHDFFSSVPDGQGSWLLQDDPRLSDASMKTFDQSVHDGEDAVLERCEDLKMSEKGHRGISKTSKEVETREDAELVTGDLCEAVGGPSTAERLLNRKPLNKDQFGLAGGDLSDPAHAPSNLKESNYVEIPGSIVHREFSHRRHQEMLLSSLSGEQDNSHTVPSGASAPQRAANPASAARSEQKRRMADKAHGDRLWRLKLDHERYATVYDLNAAIKQVEGVMAELGSEPCQKAYESYRDALAARLAAAESEGGEPKGFMPQQGDTTSRQHTEPVSPKPKQNDESEAKQIRNAL